MMDRALAIAPYDLDTLAAKADIYRKQGDLDAAWQLLAPHPFPRAEWAGVVYYQQYYLRRDYDKLIAEFKTWDLADKHLPPILVIAVQALIGNLPSA